MTMTTEFEKRTCFACRGVGQGSDITCQDAITPGPFAGGACTECRGRGFTEHLPLVDTFVFEPSETTDDIPDWMC